MLRENYRSLVPTTMSGGMPTGDTLGEINNTRPQISVMTLASKGHSDSMAALYCQTSTHY